MVCAASNEYSEISVTDKSCYIKLGNHANRRETQARKEDWVLSDELI